MMKLSPFLILILLLQSASAYTYLNIYLEENGNAIFLGETSETLSLPEGINTIDSIISGSTQELTNKEGNIWTFSYSLQDADLNIILPKNSILKSPSNGEISLEKGRISIYTQNSITLTYTIEEISGQYVLLVTILIILVIMLSIILFFYFRRNKTKKTDKLEIIKEVLSEREKLILETLKKSGKIKSSYLRKLTQLPKASFARHIQQLEKKNLIKRSGEGRNKFVEIIE